LYAPEFFINIVAMLLKLLYSIKAPEIVSKQYKFNLWLKVFRVKDGKKFNSILTSAMITACRFQILDGSGVSTGIPMATSSMVLLSMATTLSV
jgi:hypothetical protein